MDECHRLELHTEQRVLATVACPIARAAKPTGLATDSVEVQITLRVVADDADVLVVSIQARAACSMNAATAVGCDM